jgi:hypothetical protein
MLDIVIVGTAGKGLTVTIIDFVATQEFVNNAVVTKVYVPTLEVATENGLPFVTVEVGIVDQE